MYVTHSTQTDGTHGPCHAIAAPQSRKQAHVWTRHTTGSHLFHEGDAGALVYEVRSGSVRLTRVLENGRRQVIAFGLPGDIIGFPNGDRHHTDCDIIANADIVAYPRRMLETEGADPQTHQRLLDAALNEITAMQDHFMMLGRKSAVEKVASFLLVLAQRTGTLSDGGMMFSLPMSRADIADFLGLTVETVSRTFSLLRKRGIISLETPQTVSVHDHGGLVAASQDPE